eukprot:Polyplicarium_translucidae@DN3331_c2_g1_i8.p1
MFFPEKCHWSGRQRNASLTTSVAGCGERCLLQAAVLAASISRFVGDHSDEIGESDRAVIEGGGPSCDDFNVANTGQKTHKCDMCDKRFKQVKYRNKHFNEVHLRTKSFECEVCHKRFSRGYNLQTHMRIHTGERPFKCDLCEMAFVTNEALGQHNRTHTGEKPHECPTCHQAFAQHSNLTVHMRVHTGETPFKCRLTCPQPADSKRSTRRPDQTHGYPRASCSVSSAGTSSTPRRHAFSRASPPSPANLPLISGMVQRDERYGAA